VVLLAAFLVVAALVVSGLGWVTAAALGVEASELQAVARAEQANKERIALWRLDGQLLPALGLENNRPFSHYTALSDPLPAVVSEKESLASSEVRLPSPLLGAELPAWMPLHFTFDPDAGWSSPQVLAAPLAGKLRSLDVPLSNVTDARAEKLAELRTKLPAAAVAAVLATLDPADPADPNPVILTANDMLSQVPADPTNAPFRNPQAGGGAGGFGGRAGVPQRLEATQAPGPPQQYVDPEYLNRMQATTKSMMARGGYDNTTNPRNSSGLPTTPPGEVDKLHADKLTGGGPPPAAPASIAASPPPPVPPPAPAMTPSPSAPAGRPAGPAEMASGRAAARPADGGPRLEEAKREADTEDAPARAAGAAALTKEAADPPAGTALQAAGSGPAKKEAATPPPAPVTRRITARPVAAHVGPLRPVWLTAGDGSDTLLLVRPARLESGKTVYQGVLVDWPALQRELTALVGDLFPDATLAPVRGPNPASPERTMTAIPARLDPGPAPPAPSPGWSSLRLGLGLAWAAAVLGLTAVGFGGRALVDLSERRIRFVSAVTHELRTPLTSLRLYLDLLTSGMVTDPETQREYLGTLSSESDRLNRLIENVLDFARLEKRTARAVLRPTPVAELLDAVQTTWADRLAADGKELVVVSTLSPGQAVRTDPRVAAQVVGNLIDNARKYSREAADPRVWVWAKPGPRGRVLIEVEDRGPGVPAVERRGIFRAFRRGRDADTTAGGAGLGLALAKQWSGLLGGDLDYRPADGGVGACFRLELPAEG
jgi:signal transduction histidine kinase